MRGRRSPVKRVLAIGISDQICRAPIRTGGVKGRVLFAPSATQFAIRDDGFVLPGCITDADFHPVVECLRVGFPRGVTHRISRLNELARVYPRRRILHTAVGLCGLRHHHQSGRGQGRAHPKNCHSTPKRTSSHFVLHAFGHHTE